MKKISINISKLNISDLEVTNDLSVLLTSGA